MLKLIAQNKYKLMAFIIALYLLVDVLQHKGQSRVLFPKKFPDYHTGILTPQSKSTLINLNKHWKKGVNTQMLIRNIDMATAGIECDVYFDAVANNFDVHHDLDKSTGWSLDNLLDEYHQQKLTAAIWLDIKNLTEINADAVLQSLIQLRNKYNLQHKLLAESNRADLLSAFSDSGFYTSYYTPMFNPYRVNNTEMRFWVDSISAVIKNARVNALSGYYFQYPFLQYYFPDYPVLIWSANDRFSFVNWLYQRKTDRDKSILIALHP